MGKIMKLNPWDRLFDRYMERDFYNSIKPELPMINVKEGQEDYKLELSVAGYGKDNIHIKVDYNKLIIKGKREIDPEDKKYKIIRREYPLSSFNRTFILPEKIDTKNIVANTKDGILYIYLPKMQDATVDIKRKVEIK